MAAPDFDPVTLRLFVAVCEEGNIARAAAREALVASAVSKRIAAVEAQIGAPLLVRGRRGIEPTAAGQVLLRQARQVLSVMARMHAELSEFATGVQGSVRAVREGTADMGVLWDATELSGLAATRYRSDHLCLVMAAGHRWARRRRIAFADALDELTVSVAPGGMMDVMLRREAARLGRTPAWRIQVSGMDAAARIVAAGLGPSILPREAVEGHAVAQALALVPLSDAWAERHFRVISRADGSATATARQLVQHLATSARLGR